mmetsp:Transcript_20712/g.46116  ORF Transcript_20712/g.46116 Transcript_20712/m.46116 type:complete len:290 (-) Transcript_20712:1598-2467(-)
MRSAFGLLLRLRLLQPQRPCACTAPHLSSSPRHASPWFQAFVVHSADQKPSTLAPSPGRPETSKMLPAPAPPLDQGHRGPPTAPPTWRPSSAGLSSRWHSAQLEPAPAAPRLPSASVHSVHCATAASSDCTVEHTPATASPASACLAGVADNAFSEDCRARFATAVRESPRDCWTAPVRCTELHMLSSAAKNSLKSRLASVIAAVTGSSICLSRAISAHSCNRFSCSARRARCSLATRIPSGPSRSAGPKSDNTGGNPPAALAAPPGGAKNSATKGGGLALARCAKMQL